MSVVRIPPVLRANAGGAKQVEVAGSTVGEVLQSLVSEYPSLREQLFASEGELNRFVNVYLDGQDVRYLQEQATPVGERDTVVILPAMAGGDASASPPGGDAPASPARPAGGGRL